MPLVRGQKDVDECLGQENEWRALGFIKISILEPRLQLLVYLAPVDNKV